MSDSRITIALGEVRAASELLSTAAGRLNELLAEDPYFGLMVAADLTIAENAILGASVELRLAVEALDGADRAENRRTA